MIRPKLENFYGTLNDEQKARLTASGEEQRKAAATSGDKASLAPSCGSPRPPALEWPTSEIEARIHPTDTQRAALQVLQDTSARSADALKAACQTEEMLTPPARLAAAARRLEAMQQAVKQVRAALEDFYATLNDEQRAHVRGDRAGTAGLGLLSCTPRSQAGANPAMLAAVRSAAMQLFGKTKRKDIWDEPVEDRSGTSGPRNGFAKFAVPRPTAPGRWARRRTARTENSSATSSATSARRRRRWRSP